MIKSIQYLYKPIIFTLVIFVLTACTASEELIPAPTNISVVARDLPTATYTPVPTDTPIPSPTPTFTLTPTRTPSPTPTITPSPTPVPDEIVFQSNRDGDFEIYIMNIGGNNQRQLTFNDFDDNYPRVSPDGRLITFESQRDGNGEIYVMNRDGSDQRRLTIEFEEDRLPSFSPDSQQIIFASDRSGAADIYLINVDGTGLQQITVTSAREGHPVWSIQNRLAFNASIELFWQIYTTDLQDITRQRLTFSRIDEWSPEWSPDGTKIIYLSEQSEGLNPDIFLMNADGSDAHLLYDNDRYKWGACWSADGTSVLFTEDQANGAAALFMIDVTGANVRLVTERGSYPSWAKGVTPSP